MSNMIIDPFFLLIYPLPSPGYLLGTKNVDML